MKNRYFTAQNATIFHWKKHFSPKNNEILFILALLFRKNTCSNYKMMDQATKKRRPVYTRQRFIVDSNGWIRSLIFLLLFLIGIVCFLLEILDCFLDGRCLSQHLFSCQTGVLGSLIFC